MTPVRLNPGFQPVPVLGQRLYAPGRGITNDQCLPHGQKREQRRSCGGEQKNMLRAQQTGEAHISNFAIFIIVPAPSSIDRTAPASSMWPRGSVTMIIM